MAVNFIDWGSHQPATSHWQTLSDNVVSSTPRLCEIRTHKFTTLVMKGTDCIGNCKSNHHNIMTTTKNSRNVWINTFRIVLLNGKEVEQLWSAYMSEGISVRLNILQVLDYVTEAYIFNSVYCLLNRKK